MKKFKLFALAAFAMMCLNAHAQDGTVWVSGQKTTVNNIQYTVTHFYKTPANANQRNTVSVKANNFTAAALNLGGTIDLDIEVTKDYTGGDGTNFTGKATFIVNEIEADGFKGVASITSVSLPANLEFIGASAFEGCENLATVTLAASSKLSTIGIGAFAWTSITSLDLSTATEFDDDLTTPLTKPGMIAFGTDAATYNPFISATHATNAMIEEVILPNTCVTIEEKAFTGCTALTTVDMKAVKTIDANAFLNCAALTAATIGTAPKVAFEAGSGDGKGIIVGATAFSGCTALASVELGKLASATAVAADAFTGCTGLKTLKYNDVAIAQTSKPFAALTSIEKVYFQKYIALDGAIPAASFNVQADGAKLKNIYYDVELPATIANNPFLAATFAADADDAKRVAELSCPNEYFIAAAGFNKNAKFLNGVTIGASAAETIGAGENKELVKDANSSNYYYYYKSNGNRSIAKKQESGATVTVYSAYIDVVDHVANIYLQPLRVSGGKYVVDNGKVVIIKSDKKDGVVAENGGTSTMDAAISNILQITDDAVSALTVKTGGAYLNSGAKSLWFLNNPAKSGFGFTKYDTQKQSGLAKNCVYMICDDAAAAGRLNIVWLDEDGNTTAIQRVENKTQATGAIYNLRGEKVNASYKGLVIKDGKKYIQK